MAIMEAFHEGGWGMYPTLIFGFVMLSVAVKYAVTPAKRFVPLLVALGVLTLSSGTLGFVTGLIKSISAVREANLQNLMFPLLGAGEALHNVGLALMCLVLAALAAAVGAFKLSRQDKAVVEA